MTRQEIASATAAAVRSGVQSGVIRDSKALVGLDGFVDEILHVVDKRFDNERFERLATIEQFGRKILAAAGQSSNYEFVVQQMKLGGNGPIMANALASHGLGVTYVGALGYPTVHPVFAGFAQIANVVSIADSGHTDAVEFEDGKLMLGKLTSLNDVNWKTIVERLGVSALRELVNSSRLIAMTNWTMLPHMGEVWDKLASEVLPGLPAHDKGRRLFFVDLADPEKRTGEDLLAALRQLSGLQRHVDVILGLNLKESTQVADVLGIKTPAEPEPAIEATARSIRAALSIHTVVIHPRKGAAAADAGGSAAFVGPFVKSPKISTGAGDHFNAGFCLGRVLGLGLAESLCTGVATSGYYVRTAVSPTAQQLADFIAELPPGE